VVVEGVETEEQLAKLKEIGCDLGQGYHFAGQRLGEEAQRLLVESVSF
jgi:EAL domain-containing protein (putative c-di-GMP-specific phosphodiesterase class I)